MASYFDTSIEYVKGVGPQRAKLLKEELNIQTFGDLITHYPFRYEDRTRFYSISELNDSLPYVQIKGKLRSLHTLGGGRRKRLVGYLSDETGEIELVWFKGINWIIKKLSTGLDYVVFGKPSSFGKKLNIAHPEIELLNDKTSSISYLQPVYNVTEKLRSKFLDSKAIAKIQMNLLKTALPKIGESLPKNLLEEYSLIHKAKAIQHIHFPSDKSMLDKALFRLKFEELFFIQMKLLMMKVSRMEKFKGQVFDSAELVTKFYENHLPFELTTAQKRVVKEAYKDMRSGSQMNRLLQGDVGSGKTIVAFLCMLLTINGGAQATMMAPTEILANQHYKGLKTFADKMNISIALLTGSTKASERKAIHQALKSGELHILVGTHALLEDVVQFNNLGLAVIDEQHRFGVAQRSRLWKKNESLVPHVIVMTATPIPRTLAMALYGDLDISVIDELPKGRKPIITKHHYDSNRLQVNGFIRRQIEAGRQVYIVYPLIEESEKSDLKDLMDGYESISRAFPEMNISIVHGRMKSDTKDYEMNRFRKGETHIMVATTVIEVGVDIPNATVMVVENAERFGLAQLHQLRGRVGRGADQSFCILMTRYELGKEARTRIETMVRTNNGFDIADVDLKLRGPGDLAGTQQSGLLDLTVADLAKDGKILQVARQAAIAILKNDPHLDSPENSYLNQKMKSISETFVNWSRVS